MKDVKDVKVGAILVCNGKLPINNGLPNRFEVLAVHPQYGYVQLRQEGGNLVQRFTYGMLESFFVVEKAEPAPVKCPAPEPEPAQKGFLSKLKGK